MLQRDDGGQGGGGPVQGPAQDGAEGVQWRHTCHAGSQGQGLLDFTENTFHGQETFLLFLFA